MTAKKKPTITSIKALEKQYEIKQAKYYRMSDKLRDARERIEEGLVETVDGVEYVVVRKKDRYNSDTVVFLPLKK
jgi:hypothetical protein